MVLTFSIEMSKHLKAFFLVLLSFTLWTAPCLSEAQNKKADNKEREADAFFEAQNFKLAEESYREVLKKDPNNYKAMFRIAWCNSAIDNIDESIRWYENAYALNPKGNDTLLFFLGGAYKKIQKYTVAKETFLKFRREWPNKTDDYFKAAKTQIESCDWASRQLQQEPEFTVEPVDFNSVAGDYYPAFYVMRGDTFVVFTSHRTASLGNQPYNGTDEPARSDLWMVKKNLDGTFGAPVNMGMNVNTKANDGAAVFSPNRMTMYYSICEGGNFREINCSIYQSKYNPETKQWGRFEPLETINGTREVVINSRGKTKKVNTYDTHPALSSDGKIMFFVSDREGGKGQLDIWYSRKTGDMWSTPVNAGEKINTPFNEVKPSLTEDGTLYFSSTGNTGFGGYDIFRSRGEIGNWNEPENMGSPINSSYDDMGIIWALPDTVGFFNSNRKGGQGRQDIYTVTRIPKDPFKVTVHGLIRDKKTKQAIPFATAILFENEGDGIITPLDTFRTDQSGGYYFGLKPNKDYRVMGNAREYLANEVEFTTRNITKDTELEYDIDIYLERIEIDAPIVLQNIYYDFDKYDLRPESVVELDRLTKIMNDNPHITIELGSHTDTNGSEEYNIQLSRNRAKSVVEYLLKNKISPDRLTFRGYGESQPMVYPEMNDADEQANRRTEFRIKSMDYTPKDTL